MNTAQLANDKTASQRYPRVCVCQIGSRRNYAVPLALTQAGVLEKLYTDWYAPKSVLTRTAACVSQCVRWRALRRAATRVVPELPTDRVVHFPGFAVAYKWKKYWASRRGETPRAYIWGGEEFCRRVTRYGIPPCEVVYCFSSAARELFQMLEDRPTLRVLDQEIPPLTFEDRLVRDQEAAYSEWCRERPRFNGVEEYSERQRQEWDLTDVILCPSQFCHRALLEEGAPENKIRLLPFGIHPRFFHPAGPKAHRAGLRVLFVGNSPVRKGLPDLVLALERLKSPQVHAMFVGEASSLTPYAVMRARRVGDLLGSVPRTQMGDLYRSADVFVLPTVSDVFPAVVLEAMAAGLPVITTPNCGSGEIIRDGVEGFIVPVRAPDAIGEKLAMLLENPEKRIEMGQAACERAREFTIERYRERLLAILHQETTCKS